MAAVSCCGGKFLLHEADLTRAIKAIMKTPKNAMYVNLRPSNDSAEVSFAQFLQGGIRNLLIVQV